MEQHLQLLLARELVGLKRYEEALSAYAGASVLSLFTGDRVARLHAQLGEGTLYLRERKAELARDKFARRTTGSPSWCEPDGDRATIVSRGGHVPPGRTRRSSTGQRVAGGIFLKRHGLSGRAMRKSSLIPDDERMFLWKAPLRPTAKSGVQKSHSLSCNTSFYPLSQVFLTSPKRQSLSESALDSIDCPKVLRQ